MSSATQPGTPIPGRLAMTLLLGLLASFAPMTIDLYLPAFPIMARDLATDAESIQLTLSVYMVGFALSQTIFGPISDRFGRKPTIMIGTSIYLVASVACALATTVEQLIETITIIGPPGSFISPGGPMNHYLGGTLTAAFFLALGIALSQHGDQSIEPAPSAETGTTAEPGTAEEPAESGPADAAATEPEAATEPVGER